MLKQVKVMLKLIVSFFLYIEIVIIIIINIIVIIIIIIIIIMNKLLCTSVTFSF